ncbi:MAG: tRNA 4-thiouridine(8) synthase ThiI [Candidatus Omnitrophica bacterium]|nr:tRNA 4-thiouridine(8) synthase ThiI [Candidatus Omnitrophota bacterium]
MKALSLFSGGLDSMLAIKIMVAAGIDVLAIHFVTPFARFSACDEAALIEKVKERLGVPLKVIHLGDEFLEIIRNPKFGYGKNLNPCIDCKILMFSRAKALLEGEGASFVVSGEVVGQRPKSQFRETLRQIEKQAGLEDLILRPLCATALPPTIHEMKGWVKKESLYGINGRGRKAQLALAKTFCLTEYSQPGGGCLLTVSSFCTRIEDLLKHQELTCENVPLLHLGRHFRLNPDFKLVVGKDATQNEKILALAKPEDVILEPKDLPGPTALGRGRLDEETKKIAAQIVARYTVTDSSLVAVTVKYAHQTEEIICPALEEPALKSFMR